MENPITDYKRWAKIRASVEIMCKNSPNNLELQQHLENADRELMRLSVEVSNLRDDEAILETDTD